MVHSTDKIHLVLGYDRTTRSAAPPGPGACRAGAAQPRVSENRVQFLRIKNYETH